ncbi:MAG: ubiquinol oxidase subunit II [Rhizobium sp.]|nr:MAG: ubiquinol oxidase subunit II [Rhizobium sp.]
MIRRAAGNGAWITACALAAGCSGGVLDPHGPITAAEKTILLNSVAIMLAIVVPVIVATLGVAWWYRASNGAARYAPDWSYSGKIEIVVWSIPAMVILLLGGIAWIGSHDLDPPRPLRANAKTLTIEVVSLDWKWLFLYPEQGVASVNRMVVPAGTPISLKLTAATVMNNFFVPQLGSQIYTMPGMTTRLNLLADHPGQFRGLSAQFSGDGFSAMGFTVDAMPPQEFETWASTARGKDRPLNAESYLELAKPSQRVAPTTYDGVDPGLFDAIVGMKLSASTTPRSDNDTAFLAAIDPICRGK